MPPIGFALLTHARPEQLARLVERLDRSYGDAPVACHHDFGQCPIDAGLRARLDARVRFVTPHLPTAWGSFASMEATIAVLRLLFDGPDAPEWGVLLTGADYPVAPAARVLADLRASGADAHIDHRRVRPTRRGEWNAGAPADPVVGFRVGEGPCNQRMTAERYYGLLRVPLPDRRLRWRLRRPQEYIPGVSELVAPFGPKLRCYVGSAFFTLNRRAAEVLFERHESAGRLKAWYGARPIPEESYPHTLLANASGLRVDVRDFRFIDWSAPQPASHPAVLTEQHWPAIRASGAHFARKFDPVTSSALLDRIDTWLDTSTVPALV